MPNASFVARPYHGDLLFLRRETPDFFSYTKVRTTGVDPIFFVHAGKQGVLHPYPSTPYLLVWQGFKLGEGHEYTELIPIDESDGDEAVGGVGDFEGNGMATIVVNEDQGITLIDLEDNAPHSSRRLHVPPGPVAKLVFDMNGDGLDDVLYEHSGRYGWFPGTPKGLGKRGKPLRVLPFFENYTDLQLVRWGRGTAVVMNGPRQHTVQVVRAGQRPLVFDFEIKATDLEAPRSPDERRGI